MCDHNITLLMGTADGIVCRGCGRLFASFDEIKKETDPAPAEAPESPAKKSVGRKKKEA